MQACLNKQSRWLLISYAVVLLALLPLQSLWLDELMELTATRSHGLLEVLQGYAAHSAGQSPLGALEQSALLHVLGYSVFVARLPAALASILAVAGTFQLARLTTVRHVWAATVLLATFPLQLRYGAEGRPYSQALAVSVWLTWFILQLANSAWPWYAGYTALLTAGLYTQPYVLFVAVAHMAWLASVNRRSMWKLAMCVAVAGLLYAPWYLSSRRFWTQEVNADKLHFAWQAKLPLLIARELLGTGYVGTALMAALIACALLFRRGPADVRRLLLWCIFVPIFLAVAADASFDYFFAIRQIITVLPAIAILSAFGLESFGKRCAALTLAAALSLNVSYAARWFAKPREDWALAADAIARSIGPQGCWFSVPAGTADYYEFFRPELQGRVCSSIAANGEAVAVAVSPYLVDPGARAATEMQFRQGGYSVEQIARLPEVLLFRRPDSGRPAHSPQ